MRSVDAYNLCGDRKDVLLREIKRADYYRISENGEIEALSDTETEAWKRIGLIIAFPSYLIVENDDKEDTPTLRKARWRLKEIAFFI